jgi:prophage antirepressor-like protein
MNTNKTERENNQLVPFSFENRTVRTVVIENEPWFVAKDVCDTLGLDQVTRALDSLDDDEVSNLTNSKVRDFDVPNRGLSIVNESGLYALIFRSRKPEAKRFRKWVTTEVLPQIRRTGTYGAGAIAGRAYSFFSGMSVRRINKLFFLCSVEPPLLQEDIAYLVGMSEGTLSTFLKRFGRREFGKIVRELRIDAYGCSALYAADRAKKARVSLTAKGAEFCRKSLEAKGARHEAE